MGKFFEGLVGQMKGTPVGKEGYGNEEFQKSCKPSDFDASPKIQVTENTGNPGETDAENEATVIEVKEEEKDKDEMPVLVFEGLPEPRGQSEEGLIESILSQTVQIPKSSVRRAVRLPIKSNGKSLVIVEMDTIENEEKVLQKIILPVTVSRET